MKKFQVIDWLALLLVIIGGLNWALVGVFNFDLVAFIFGDMSILSRIVYILVGVGAVYLILSFPGGKEKEEVRKTVVDDTEKDFRI